MLSHNSQLSDGKGQKLVRTDSLIIKNLKTNKVLQIYREIGKKPVLSFGNSSGDEAMHNYCLSNTEHRTKVFMLVADDNVRDHAHTGWRETERRTHPRGSVYKLRRKSD